MGGPSQRRLGIALWSAFGTQAVGLAVGFVLAEPTSLRPDHSPDLITLSVLFIAGSGAAVTFVLVRNRRESGTVWWAAASATALLAVMVMLLEAGVGAWFAWCAMALLSSFAGIFASLRRAGRPEPEGGDDAGTPPSRRTGKAAAALAAVALVAAMSMGAGMEDVDYSGTWTARPHELTLTLTGASHGQGHYTLRWGACSEEATWSLDYPHMTTSVQVWLHRDVATACLPGPEDVMLRVAGGTVAAPVLDFTGPDGTTWLLTKP